MKELLERLHAGEYMNESEARDTLIKIAAAEFSDAETASFLTVFRMRALKLEELEGFREAMMQLAIKLDFSEFNTLDLCGTGGDGKNTFNISTLSSFIVAGAGQKVAKHGNYGVSSVSGSSDMLEFFGYKFTNDETELKKQLHKLGICILHAPLFHPAMKNVAPVRKALKLKTIFNILGPLVNPSEPGSRLTGVYNEQTLDLYGQLLEKSDEKFCIVFSKDGYDEISLTSDFIIYDNKGKRQKKPDEIGRKKYPQASLHGGKTVKEAADIFKNILEGKGTEAQNSVVLSNSAFALKTAQQISYQQALEKAERSLFDKKALEVFTKLVSR